MRTDSAGPRAGAPGGELAQRLRPTSTRPSTKAGSRPIVQEQPADADSPGTPCPDGRTVQPGRSPATRTRTAEPTTFIPGTNAIESLNARFWQATTRRGHFPDSDAALKVLCLVVQDRRPGRANRQDQRLEERDQHARALLRQPDHTQLVTEPPAPTHTDIYTDPVLITGRARLVAPTTLSSEQAGVHFADTPGGTYTIRGAIPQGVTCRWTGAVLDSSSARSASQVTP